MLSKRTDDRKIGQQKETNNEKSLEGLK